MTTNKKAKTVLLPLRPKTVFLIDAGGAALTCFTIGYLLPRLQWLIGVLPSYVYILLAGIAFVFAVYSGYHAMVTVRNWRFRLWLISTANIMYCVLTLGFVVLNMGSLNVLGIIYFLIESAVVIWLARQEYWYSGIKVNPANLQDVLPRPVGSDSYRG